MWFKNSDKLDAMAENATAIADRAMRHWSLWWENDADVFLEKSIVHGAWMPGLQTGFRNARFIGVIRNGYCACEGIRRRAQPTDGALKSVGSRMYPLDMVGKQWFFANEVLERDKALVSHYHEVRYEDFTKDPLGSVKQIFRFIGVDDSLVEFVDDESIRVNNRTFNICDQNCASLDRLSEYEKQTLWKTIKPIMLSLGYPKE